MKLNKIPFDKTGFFPSTIIDYLAEKPELLDLISGFPSKENFEKQIAQRSSFSSNTREILSAYLHEQYDKLEDSRLESNQIEKLKDEKTFTVTTGHQLNIFTGPIFFIYKITSTLALCRQLKKWFPENEFVPVYWMATEDHDLAEIDHTWVFNKPVKWETEQEGPVGRMELAGFDKVLQEVSEILGEGDEADELRSVFKRAYSTENLSQATATLVDHLFGDRGLVVLDADSTDLKRVFAPVMKSELKDSFASSAIENANKKLEALGYNTQVHAREINLFYIKKGLRERIVEEDGRFEVLNTEISFTSEELDNELEQHPGRFSPNVVLRPVYQEVILPNIAYIGGGGELSYWLQLKPVFEVAGAHFPILVLRNSCLIVDGGNAKKMKKLEIKLEDLFEDEEWLVRHYIEEHADVTLEEAREKVKAAFKRVVEKALQIDPTLEKKAKAEEQSQLNSLDNLEKRLIKAAKQKDETTVRQIRQLKQHLFPDNGLQERRDNFMEYYFKHGSEFLSLLLENFDPLEGEFYVFVQE